MRLRDLRLIVQQLVASSGDLGSAAPAEVFVDADTWRKPSEDELTLLLLSYDIIVAADDTRLVNMPVHLSPDGTYPNKITVAKFMKMGGSDDVQERQSLSLMIPAGWSYMVELVNGGGPGSTLHVVEQTIGVAEGA